MVHHKDEEPFMWTLRNIKRSTVFTLLAGAVLGFGASYLLFSIVYSEEKWTTPLQQMKSLLKGPQMLLADEMIYRLPGDMHDADPTKDVRLLCCVLTQPASHELKARHVRNTWGRRCDYLIFMSTIADYSLPAVRLKVKEGRNHLWAKTKESFKYAYQHYLDRVDWVLKADDDTYVIVENLKMLLSGYDPMEKLYFGCRFKPFSKNGYMSGGAGYVLSKAAVKAFVEDAMVNKSCRSDGGGAEDVEMGKCLGLVNAKYVDSRDSQGRHRFLPLPPSSFLAPAKLPPSNWFWHYTYYPLMRGFNCCSDTMVSFHYISPPEMYVLEYFIYQVKAYGHTGGETSFDERGSRSTLPEQAAAEGDGSGESKPGRERNSSARVASDGKERTSGAGDIAIRTIK